HAAQQKLSDRVSASGEARELIVAVGVGGRDRVARFQLTGTVEIEKERLPNEPWLTRILDAVGVVVVKNSAANSVHVRNRRQVDDQGRSVAGSCHTVGVRDDGLVFN